MNLDYAKNSIEEVPFGQYLEQFQALDPEAASTRTGIPYDSERKCFTMRMLQKTYEISWPDCNVICLDKTEDTYAIMEEAVDAKIFSIRYLLNGVQSASTGKYLTYRELPSGDLYFQQFQGRCLMRLAYGFGFKLEKFADIFERLGAKKLTYGDVSYEIEFINDHFVRFILWAGDDEFPPSSQILFSDNFPLSFETYDLAVVGDISITTLKKMQ